MSSHVAAPRQLRLTGTDYRSVFPRRFDVLGSIVAVVGVGFALRASTQFAALVARPLQIGADWGPLGELAAPFGISIGCLITAALIGLSRAQPYLRLTWSAGSWFLLCLACGYGAMAALSVGAYRGSVYGAIAGGVIAWALMRYGALAFAIATRHAQASALSVLQRDPRPPVVYLRSFSADHAAAPSPYRLVWRWWRALLRGAIVTPRFWVQQREWTFEEVLVEGMGLMGPVVTIGRPGERLPSLGAARMYLTDDGWEAAVAAFLRQAQIVCLHLGTSPGLMWELSFSVRESLLARTLLVFPPNTPSSRVWEEVLAGLTDAGVRDRLPSRVHDGTIAVMFDEGSEPVLVVGKQTIENYRRLAYYVSHSVAAAQRTLPPNRGWHAGPGELATVAGIRARTRISLVSFVAIYPVHTLAVDIGGRIAGSPGLIAGSVLGVLIGVYVELAMLALLLGVSQRTLLVCRVLKPEARVESWCDRLLYAQKRLEVVDSGNRHAAQKLTNHLLRALNALSRVPSRVRGSEQRTSTDQLELRCLELIEEFESQSALSVNADDSERRDAMVMLCASAKRLARQVVLIVLAARTQEVAGPTAGHGRSR